ncbi:hypothetical protein FHX48_001253 [Microbacterium halimionae]|uniref:Mucin-associated surface protein n=1 Tax=Microbacterium halimionae TaxID=1526413 RepID=A0A7W3PL42_9MICO|nr:hypothetical protein [Microbacterium halimionae]MBA8816180.1 hypothetical protein [Microbacterium halimionae]NII96382.1 hypothetical protein [Microbacterium halimionae]
MTSGNFSARSMGLTAALLLGILLLSGCQAASDPDGTAESDALQSLVVDAADASAVGDYETALGILDEVTATAEAQSSSGSIEVDELTRITTAVQVVRDDIATLLAAEVAEQEAITPSESPVATEQTDSNESNQNMNDSTENSSNGKAKGKDKEKSNKKGK